MRFLRFLALILFGVAILSSCDSALDKQDPIANLSRADFETLRGNPKADDGPPVPHLALHTQHDGIPRIASDKILSISVTEKVPLKDVLMELATKAGVDIEIDPRIEGGVIFTATRQPFPRILDRLCRVAGLRYSVDDRVVRVELDEPYLKTYSLDYLSLARKSDSQIGIATNVFASVANVTRNGVVTPVSQDAQNGNNSVTKVDTTAVADFWPEVEANIESILANTGGTGGLRTDAATNVQLKQAGISPGKPFVTNRQAGLVTVFGSKRQQDEVSSYLDKLKRNVNAQVLIEARIVEVQLNENYQSGINWRTIMGGPINAAARFGPAAAAAPFINSSTATDGVVTLSLNTGDFGGILNFVRGFGTTRTLSSPRLTVLNNQPAVLKVARNEVYFTSTVESTPVVNSGGSAVAVTRTVNSTPNTVPVGFVMTVQPAINLNSGEVTLNLRPTVSFIVDRVQDPGVQIAAADANVPNVTSSIPVVAVREMDSVLKLPSGTVAVMGGLMQDSAGMVESGVPFADELPVVGNLAKSKGDTGQLSELVILLRATIVDAGPQPDQKDRDLYQRFTQDRHPLPMPAPPAPPENLKPGLVHAAYHPGKDATGFTLVAYYKRKTVPLTEEQKAELAKKPKKKKKKHHHRPGSHAPTQGMQVSPPTTPPPPMPPTVVPDYDKRPDTMPED